MRARISLFGPDEVAIVSKFDDELHEWADVDLVEKFLAIQSMDKRREFIDTMPWSGDTLLTRIFLKTLLFKMVEGYEWKKEVLSLGVNIREGNVIQAAFFAS